MSGILFIIFAIILYVIYQLAFIYAWNKKINRIINISLLISLFILPDSIACFTFLILVLRLLVWLFGPSQDVMDEYYYSRYERAKRNYDRRER